MRIVKFALAIVLALWVTSVDAQTLVCGPFLQNPTSEPDKMSVTACFNSVTTATLEVDNHGSFTLTSGPIISGPSAVTNHNPAGGTWTIGSMARWDLTGLSPGKSYSYRIKDQAGTVIDKGGTFRAFKTSGDVRFAAIGDFGTAGGHEAEVSCEMAKRDLDFYVTLGDNVYHSNYQSIGRPSGWPSEPWPLLTWWMNYGCFRDLQRNVPVFVIGGNHDVYVGLNYFFLGGSRGVIRNGDMVFVRTMTYGGSTGGSATGVEYKNWIDASLAASSDKPFKFVGGHYAAHHCDAAYIYDANIRANWVPIFEKHGVDGYIAGHHHSYQRFKVNGVNYVVDGRGAGSGTFGSACTSALLSARNQGGGGFSLVTIVDGVMTHQAIKVLRNTTGGYSVSVVDSLTINKHVEPPPPVNLPPDGQIVQPSQAVTVKAGESVNFQGIGVDPEKEPVAYEWKIGSAIISDQQSFTHKFDTAGAFTVELTVRDQQELPDPTPAIVAVTVEPVVIEEFGKYLASDGYSTTTQGPRWFYLEGPKMTQMTFNVANQRWQGSETYSIVGSNWQHPGNAVDSIRRFIVAGNGSARVTGEISRANTGAGSVLGLIKHNGTTVWQQVIGQGQKFPFDVTLAAVKVGDTIDFNLNDNSTAATGGNSHDSTGWNPLIEVKPPVPLPPPAQCNDGLDNDGDKLIDMNDPGCADSNDNDETDPVPPPQSQPISVPPQPKFALGNGTDGPANVFDLNKAKPRPAPYPRLDLPSFAGSGTGRSWSQYVIDPWTQANSTYAKGTPIVCHRRDGVVSAQWLYYQSGNTYELAATRASGWIEFGGARNQNTVSPYNVMVSDPDAGMWGVGMQGNVWIAHDSGRIAFVHGVENVVENGKIYCGEKRYIGTYDKKLLHPNDIALAYRDGKKHRFFIRDDGGRPIGNDARFFIADTGNNRVAVLEVTEIKGVVTKSDLKTYADIPNAYSLTVAPDNTIYVASKSGSAIYKIDPHGVVTKLVSASGIAWIRLTSRGDLAWANDSARQVYVYEFTTNANRFVDVFYSGGGNWIWGEVDVKGSVGPVDDALFVVSQTLPGTPVRMSLYGTPYKSQMPNGGPLSNGRVNFPGVGNVQIDPTGHYPWAIAIADHCACFYTTGFGDLGIRRFRRLRVTGEPAAFNVAKYQRGRSQWRWGYPAFGTTVPPGTTTYASLATLHGWYGFSHTGLPNADDIVEWPIEEQKAYLRSGADGLPQRTMTDAQVLDALYYLCMHSRKGILSGCPATVYGN